MAFSNRFCGLSIAAFAAAALFAAQPAAADTIEINNVLTGSGSTILNLSGTDWHNGRNATSFNFVVDSNDTPGTYSLNKGDFTTTGTGSSIARMWLEELGIPSNSNYAANIWTVQSMNTQGKSNSQDMVTFAPVPEPQNYAMMLVGLGLLGVSARRKNQHFG